MSVLLETRLTADYGGAPVLRDVALTMERGEIVGLAGQSGSGKSTLALAMLRLLGWRGGRVTGSVRLEGEELAGAPEAAWRKIRGRRMALVMQSADSALNPALRLRDQLRLAWEIHAREWRTAGQPRAEELLAQCGLPGGAEFLARYPAQISVGQAQRVLIAMALLHRPAVVIADEVTSALDLLTQQEVLQTLRRVNESYGTSILFVSHDLGALRSMCSRIAVLNAGTIVETQATEELFRNPRDPYVRRLVEALPQCGPALVGAGQ
jgi:ABC-type dipeptide/oligopeptide/nickel transport system ATPase component